MRDAAGPGRREGVIRWCSRPRRSARSALVGAWHHGLRLMRRARARSVDWVGGHGDADGGVGVARRAGSRTGAQRCGESGGHPGVDALGTVVRVGGREPALAAGRRHVGDREDLPPGSGPPSRRWTARGPTGRPARTPPPTDGACRDPWPWPVRSLRRTRWEPPDTAATARAAPSRCAPSSTTAARRPRRAVYRSGARRAHSPGRRCRPPVLCRPSNCSGAMYGRVPIDDVVPVSDLCRPAHRPGDPEVGEVDEVARRRVSSTFDGLTSRCTSPSRARRRARRRPGRRCPPPGRGSAPLVDQWRSRSPPATRRMSMNMRSSICAEVVDAGRRAGSRAGRPLATRGGSAPESRRRRRCAASRRLSATSRSWSSVEGLEHLAHPAAPDQALQAVRPELLPADHVLRSPQRAAPGRRVVTGIDHHVSRDRAAVRSVRSRPSEQCATWAKPVPDPVDRHDHTPGC